MRTATGIISVFGAALALYACVSLNLSPKSTEVIADIKKDDLPIEVLEIYLRAADASEAEYKEYEALRDRWRAGDRDEAALQAFLDRLFSDPCDWKMAGARTVEKGTHKGGFRERVDFGPRFPAPLGVIRVPAALGPQFDTSQKPPKAITSGDGTIEVDSISYDWYEINETPPVPVSQVYQQTDDREQPRGFVLGDWIYERADGCATSIDNLPPIDFNETPIEESQTDINQTELDEITDALQAASEPPLAGQMPVYTAPQEEWGFTLDCTQYLCGRDIIYVHGLDLYALQDNFTTLLGVDKWRGGSGIAAFRPGGYWYQRANSYAVGGGGHIAALAQRGATNRYILAPWALTDRATGNIGAIAGAINRGMNGEAVRRIGQPDFLDRDAARGFCNPSCVLVSDSTGALLGDIMLGLAEGTRVPGPVRQEFGELYLLTDRIKFHLAFQGAFGGSDFAPLLAKAVDAAAVAFNYNNPTAPVGPEPGLRSIAVDLAPGVASAVWHPVINLNRKPVLLVTSSSPDGIDLSAMWQWTQLKDAVVQTLGSLSGAALKLTHPGPDDSVLASSSSCANDIPGVLRPSGRFVALHEVPKVFDRGQSDKDRAMRLHWGQLHNKKTGGLPGPYVAMTCSPQLISTGMVLPPSAPVPHPYDISRRLVRHCPVILSSKLHALEAGASNGSPNDEEALIVPPECAFLYAPDANVPGDAGRYLNPAIGGLVNVSTREKVVGPVRIRFCICIKVGPIRIRHWVDMEIGPRIVLWRRQYMLLGDWPNQHSLDHVFAFVGR